jgi:hypothetical protein
MILKRLKVLADALELEQGAAFRTRPLAKRQIFPAGFRFPSSHQGIGPGDAWHNVVLGHAAITVAA